MSPKVDAFVDRHGWQIIVFVVSAVIAWTTLKAQVQDKADKSDVRAAEGRLDIKIDSIARRQESILYLMCRRQENRNDSVCR